MTSIDHSYIFVSSSAPLNSVNHNVRSSRSPQSNTLQILLYSPSLKVISCSPTLFSPSFTSTLFFLSSPPTSSLLSLPPPSSLFYLLSLPLPFLLLLNYYIQCTSQLSNWKKLLVLMGTRQQTACSSSLDGIG